MPTRMQLKLGQEETLFCRLVPKQLMDLTKSIRPIPIPYLIAQRSVQCIESAIRPQEIAHTRY